MTKTIKKILVPPLLFSFVLGCLLYASNADAADIGDIKINLQAESRRKAGVGPVIYPHKLHTDLYKCDACHPKIFKKKRGANIIDMDKNMTGKFCGSAGCHNSEKAFPLWRCDKCHAE